MDPLSTTLTFAWAALLIELTPGPNMTYLALLSARRGVRTGLAAVAGIALGLAIVGMATTFGLGQLVERSPWLYETIRWLGVLYLLWLAWEAWLGDDRDDAPGTADADERAFRDGLVTNLLNPKAAVFYMSVLPVFTDPQRSYAPQALRLALIYVAIATAVHLLIVVAAGRAGAFLADPRSRSRAGRAMALALVAVAVWVLYATRRAG